MYVFNYTENNLIKPIVEQNNDDAGKETTYLFTRSQQMPSYNPVNDKEPFRNFFSSIKPTNLLRKGNHYIKIFMCKTFQKLGKGKSKGVATVKTYPFLSIYSWIWARSREEVVLVLKTLVWF